MGGMHTHFGSATHLAATFLGVVIAGTFWRLAWMHTMRFAIKRNLRWLGAMARAALFQY
jgi:hypothetical protein